MANDGEPEIKKMKTSDFISLKPGGACKHFVKRKKRFCKMTVSNGQEYCGEHLPTTIIISQPEESSLNAQDNHALIKNERVTCPLDPKHTVYKRNLQKHLKKCNAKVPEQPDYIELGINTGGDCTDLTETTTTTTTDIAVDMNELNLQTIDKIYLMKLIDKINNLYGKCFDSTSIEALHLTHDILNDELSNTVYGMETKKHLTQTASILGLLQHMNFFENNITYIDFGGGKGKFTYWLAQILIKNPQFNCNDIILVDKASHRHKMDNKINDKDLIERIRVDIGDLNIQKLMQKLHPINVQIESNANCNDNVKKQVCPSNDRQIIAIGKHLCGAATDLTIRCITNNCGCVNNVCDDKKNEVENVYYKTKGFIITLCCHHRCTWKSYVGQSFCLENDLSKRDFIVMTKMVGWAVCGTGWSREKNKEHINLRENGKVQTEEKEDDTSISSTTATILTREVKEEIGKKCKRLLDYGRLKYLEKMGYKCSLKYYVDTSITLENVCLIGQQL